jgi:hypothetical protein
MRRIAPAAALALASCLILPLASRAQSSDAPDRVEEDWELVIAQPAVFAEGPQMTTTMSPVADNSVTFVAFNLNYADTPYRPGGLQVQVWAPKRIIAQSSQKIAQCNTANETISWTQSMKVSAGRIYYSITNGSSTTWSNFGQGSNLDVNYSTTLTDLTQYSPAYSAANSGAGWMPDHLSSMRLVRVRYYHGETLLSTDNSPRSVTLVP